MLDEAYRYATKGVALCREWNVTEILALSCVELAYIAQALGYDEESRESIFVSLSVYEINPVITTFGV